MKSKPTSRIAAGISKVLTGPVAKARRSRRQEFRRRLLNIESLEDRRVLDADGLVAEGEPPLLTDASLSAPVQDQILSLLGSLDHGAESLAISPTLNREIPGAGRSLNDLLDPANGSIDRDWGDFIQFEQTAASYFSSFAGSAGGAPTAFGLRDAIQTQIDIGTDGGFVGRAGMPALSVLGGVDDSNQLRFEILLAADASS